MVKIIGLEILTGLRVLKPSDSQKVDFPMSFLCLHNFPIAREREWMDFFIFDT
jgi:hypothetical protein